MNDEHLNEREQPRVSIEELDTRTEDLLQKTLALKQKVKNDIEVAMRHHEKAQNENR
jgi:hypothetical protein